MAEATENPRKMLLSSVTRFVCISDNHDNYDFSLPDGNILLHAGDFTRNGSRAEIETFVSWLKTQTQYRLKFIIVGNHESKQFYSKRKDRKWEIIQQLQTDKSLIKDFGIVYLQDEAFQDGVTGLKFYGSGWVTERCKDSNQIAHLWSKIPTDTDILLTHSPPHSILDGTSHDYHLGCKELWNRLFDISALKLHVFGHVHGNHGQLENNAQLPRIIFVNASLTDKYYHTAYSPIIVDLKHTE